MQYYVYLLECSDKTLYCGYAVDLHDRLTVHNSGKGAKYTRGRLPAKLVYSEAFNEKASAMKREAQIKKMKRKDKMKLVDFYALM